LQQRQWLRRRKVFYKIDTRIVPTTTFAQLYKTFWALA
jgi:hypothetical protein